MSHPALRPARVIHPRRWDVALALAVLLAAGFAVLAGRSTLGMNTLWDEMTDQRAAAALLRHPLWGSGLDGSQARLPVYVTALAYAALGVSVTVGRAVSIAFGAAAVVLTFIAGRRWFSEAAGLLAAALLAVSPYFLTFARTQMTEGDAFLPLMTLLMLLAFNAYLRKRDLQGLVLFAVAFGLALATKFYILLMLPALILCDLLFPRPAARLEGIKFEPPQGGLRTRRLLAVWSLSAAAAPILGAAAAQLQWVAVSIVLWAAGLVLLLGGAAVWLIAGKRRSPVYAADLPLDWLIALSLAAAVCLSLFPEHVIQPEVMRSLARKALRPDAAETMLRFVDPARLYAGIVLLKLGWPLGLITLAALAWACYRSSREPNLRLVTAVFILYVLLLTALPLRQAFYLMAVYPLLLLIVAHFIVRLARRLKGRPHLQAAWLALVATSAAFLLWGVIRVYPTFGYYGYETIGTRWLGAESRGYRNLVQVTNDGTEDALRWTVDHVPPGRTVVSYLWDDHVIDHFFAHRPPRFGLVQRHPEIDSVQGTPIDEADYLIIALNNLVSYHDAPEERAIEQHFHPAPVHTVWRGRGLYRMAAVQVYQRRQPWQDSATTTAPP